MSQENRDEMRPDYDIRGGERGKYLVRYRRWAGITSAEGPVMVPGVLSTSDTPKAAITFTYTYFMTATQSAPVRTHTADEASKGITFAGHAG